MDGITAIEFVGLSTSATSPSPTSPVMDDKKSTQVIVITVLVVFVLMIIVAVVVGVAVGMTVKYVAHYAKLLCCCL